MQGLRFTDGNPVCWRDCRKITTTAPYRTYTYIFLDSNAVFRYRLVRGEKGLFIQAFIADGIYIIRTHASGQALRYSIEKGLLSLVVHSAGRAGCAAFG